MTRLIDLSGQTFGRLTVIERAATRKRVTYWRCKCECGVEITTGAGGLRRGITKTCGTACLLTEGRRAWPHDPRIFVGRDGSIVSPKGRILAAWPDERGYPRVSVYTNGKHRQPHVHVMVAEAYLGLRPEGMDVAHGDGDSGNPHVNNLRWATPVENEADKLEHGTRPQGEKVYCAKLTEQDVFAIRAASSSGESLTSIERRYPVSLSTISRIVLRKIWKHI